MWVWRWAREWWPRSRHRGHQGTSYPSDSSARQPWREWGRMRKEERNENIRWQDMFLWLVKQAARTRTLLPQSQDLLCKGVFPGIELDHPYPSQNFAHHLRMRKNVVSSPAPPWGSGNETRKNVAQAQTTLYSEACSPWLVRLSVPSSQCSVCQSSLPASGWWGLGERRTPNQWERPDQPRQDHAESSHTTWHKIWHKIWPSDCKNRGWFRAGTSLRCLKIHLCHASIPDHMNYYARSHDLIY